MLSVAICSFVSLYLCHQENMIYKGLDDEEAQFLHFVMQREAEQASQRWEEEIKEVTAYRVSFFIVLAHRYYTHWYAYNAAEAYCLCHNSPSGPLSNEKITLRGLCI